jgi:hypothetical protein
LQARPTKNPSAHAEGFKGIVFPFSGGVPVFAIIITNMLRFISYL